MANNPYVNKVETADGSTLMDITDTTAEPSSVGLGEVFYAASGARSVGTFDPSLSKTISTPAAVQSFSDGAAYPMKMEITVDPVQAGSGDPSPSNVRPITGWTGTNVSVSPTQDAQDATVYPITFPTSAGTVYGGTLTVNADGTGELVVDRASLTIPTIESYDGTVSQTTFKYVSITPQQNQKRTAEEIVTTSDVLQGISFEDRRTKAFCCYGMRTSQQIIVSVDENYAVADFNSNIAGNKIVYILNETQSYTLSAPQVLSLLGQNNVWADTGNILELTYVRDIVPDNIKYGILPELPTIIGNYTWSNIGYEE